MNTGASWVIFSISRLAMARPDTIVRRANQVQSASLIVRPGQWRKTSPTVNSSR